MVAAIVADMEENKVANMEVTTITIEIATITEEVGRHHHQLASHHHQGSHHHRQTLLFILILFPTVPILSDEYRVIMTLYSILSHPGLLCIRYRVICYDSVFNTES